MAWERFTITGGRGVYDKRVSLSARGVFVLNQPTFEELGEPEAVEFLYDRDERLIGMRPTEKEVPHAYLVRKQKANKSYLIGARAFCHHYKLGIVHTIRFKDIKCDDGVLVLDLKNTVPVEIRKSTKSSQALRGSETLGFDE